MRPPHFVTDVLRLPASADAWSGYSLRLIGVCMYDHEVAEHTFMLRDWLQRYRGFWTQKLEALATEVARGQRARRSGGGEIGQERGPSNRTPARSRT